MGRWLGLETSTAVQVALARGRTQPLPLPASSQGLSPQTVPPQLLDTCWQLPEPRVRNWGESAGERAQDPGRPRRSAVQDLTWGRGTSSSGDTHAPSLPAGSPGPLLVELPAPEPRERHRQP